jgi:hypothetical protein
MRVAKGRIRYCDSPLRGGGAMRMDGLQLGERRWRVGRTIYYGDAAGQF